VTDIVAVRTQKICCFFVHFSSKLFFLLINLKFSLEERKMVERKALEIACKKKEKFRCLLSNIKEKFKQLVADSKLLTQPFHRDYFQLNEKFSVLPVKETQSEAKKLRLNLELEHENSLLDLQQVNYFVDRGIIPKLKVKGIL
jgi:hypothetical protein